MSLSRLKSGPSKGSRIWPDISRRQLAVLLAILGIQLILVSPSLMPSFPQISVFDEAKYIASGRQLLQFEVRDLAWGPLVAVVYAPLHLFFGQSADWFMLEAWSGRILLFIFLWLSTMTLGLELRPQINPYVLAGVLFVSVPFFRVVTNQSDAVFASLAALALSRLLAFRRTRELSTLAWGSLIVGLAVLSRAEAVLLLGLFPLLALALGVRHAQAGRLLASIFAPSLAVLGVYLVAFWMSTGTIDLGFQGKAYDSFETNQSVTTGGDVAAGKAEARRLFGTAEENNHSVLRAILRNPKAYASRLWASATTIPGYYLSFFQNQLGPALLLLGLWGVVRLGTAGKVGGLLVMGIWSLEPLTSIAFLPRHLVPQLTCLVLVLSAVGVLAMVRPSSAREHWIHVASWGALALFGWFDGKLALMVAGLVVLLAMALADLLGTTDASASLKPDTLFILLLAGGLVMRTPFPFPNYTALGSTSDELAIHYLEAHVPPDSLVMSPYPGQALAARVTDISPSDVPEAARNPDAFLPWMRSKGITAIYLDSQFKRSDEVYNLVNDLAGNGLLGAFATPDGRIRILIPQN